MYIIFVYMYVYIGGIWIIMQLKSHLHSRKSPVYILSQKLNIALLAFYFKI